MLSEHLMAALICPVCGGRPLGLMVDEADGEMILQGELSCPDCKRRYRVRDDIPLMMPPDIGSNLSAANERWDTWAAAMHRFLCWREAAWTDPDEAASRRETAFEMHRVFLRLCDLPGDRVDLLDVGCGTGHISDMLPDSVGYVGLDPLPGGRSPGGEMPAEIPRPQPGVSLVQGVGEMLPVGDDSFDAILMMGVLDHALSPDEVLREAARVLRPDGTLGVLVGLARADEDAGIRGVFRALVQSLTGRQSPRVRDTHLHTFSSLDEVCALLSERFAIRDRMEYASRAFVRATALVDDA